MSTSRWVGFGVVTLAYAVAGLAAWVVAAMAPGDRPLLHTLAADVAATVVVFLFSAAVGNASLYDPYWSVAPAVIVVAWALWRGDAGARQILVLTLVLIWAVRLTANWAVGWRGLGHEDWRYVRLRQQRPGWLPF